MSNDTNVLRLSDVPDPMLAQFRMRRLSVFNWGTFSGLHRMPVAHEGMLLLGPSGAGKSTLLDAISALTAPPALVHFNAAADESSRKDRDRDPMSYVRGAWADKADENSPRIIAKQYLRPQGTWSALSLEYANAQGRVATLVRVLWVRGSGTSGGVENHYMVVEGPFDLSEISDFEGERRVLKKQLTRPDIRHHEKSFADYAEHWCRVLGIPNTESLKLLHQTQSTKNLSDLNTFLRDYMLVEPPTFGVAKDLITEFIDLDEAHRAVVAAREQVEALQPAKDAFSERTDLLVQSNQLEDMVLAVPAYRAKVHARLLTEEQHRLRSAQEVAEANRAGAESKIFDATLAVEQLAARYDAQGGKELAQLDQQRADLDAKRQRNQRDRNHAEQLTRSLGWTLAPDLTGFVEQVQLARKLVEQAAHASESIEQKREQATVLESQLTEKFKKIQEEIRSLESSPSSIPHTKQQIRAKLSQELGIPLSRMPFAGELIEVKPDHIEWAGAANRLLGGFATNLLVHEDDYRKVANWVERNHLRDRWTYTIVPAGAHSSPAPVDDRSIVSALEVHQHAFRSWITGQLARSFDYERVDSIADLVRVDKGITKAGQIKYPGRRHEKDDRHDINDRRNWVLGDNREKLARFKEDAATVGAELEQASRQKREAGAEAASLSEQRSAATQLSRIQWQDIDVASLAISIDGILKAQKDARIGNIALADIEGQLVQARQTLKALEATKNEATLTIQGIARQMSEVDDDLQRARIHSLALDQTQLEHLDGRLSQEPAPTLKSFSSQIDALHTKLFREKEASDRAIKETEMLIVRIFGDFLNRWPTERGSLQPNMDSAPDFFAMLQRIELDGLPVHEERFLHLLRTQSTQRLAELYRHLTEARKDIELRMDDVNEALHTVPYNPDSFLHLRVEDLGLEDPREFRKRLTEVFQSQQSAQTDPVEAEKQFIALRQLIIDLRGDEPDKKRWRELVLDVRKHVHFIADELERKTERLIENHSGSGGKSGGQRQKLTATCLAAALRFQLGGTDGGPPSYAAVVLDEAFTKTDNDFTATCMRIFTELGFQMIVATPIKSVMTLEPFVGGATYVSISNRHTSSLQHIAYLDADKRLDLPELNQNQTSH